ncbi:MAG: acireductone synthase, partial [Sphingomonas hengshuiensis]
EAIAYTRIAEAAGMTPGDMLFLSDVAAETDAAKAAGMQALLIDRTGAAADIASFEDIAL